jgi:hypothetical protein
VGDDGLVYGFSGKGDVLRLRSGCRGRVVHSESLREFGGDPRHALQSGDDGYLYAMLRDAIVRITPGSFECEKLADTEAPATAGGALVGERVYYASGSRVWSYEIPGN